MDAGTATSRTRSICLVVHAVIVPADRHHWLRKRSSRKSSASREQRHQRTTSIITIKRTVAWSGFGMNRGRTLRAFRVVYPLVFDEPLNQEDWYRTLHLNPRLITSNRRIYTDQSSNVSMCGPGGDQQRFALTSQDGKNDC